MTKQKRCFYFDLIEVTGTVSFLSGLILLSLFVSNVNYIFTTNNNNTNILSFIILFFYFSFAFLLFVMSFMCSQRNSLKIANSVIINREKKIINIPSQILMKKNVIISLFNKDKTDIIYTNLEIVILDKKGINIPFILDYSGSSLYLTIKNKKDRLRMKSISLNILKNKPYLFDISIISKH